MATTCIDASRPRIPALPLLIPCLLLLLALLAAPVRADLIPRTITIDGTFTDWTGTGGSYSPAGNIITNPNQFSTDCQSGTACELDGNLSAAGRDLKYFAFTWDATRLYFYLERWQNSTNVTDWWFYMDTNGDLKMNTGEKVLRVRWSGSNRVTTVSYWNYSAVAAGGDLLASNTGSADGYKMPGSVNTEVTLYSTTGGGASGLQMEAYMPWSVLGASGPTNMGFHIASSNGTNLPNSLIDNMQGPGNNQLFPSDIDVQKTASASTVSGNSLFSYTVTVRNLGYSTISNLVISDTLPPNGIYQGHTAATGSYVDTNANGIPDRWNIPSLAPQTSTTLVVNVRAANLTAPVTDTNTATLTAWTGINEYTSNDSASASVLINPGPLLATLKTASAATASPGQVLRYRVLLSNSGYSVATSVVAIDALSPFTAFRLNTFGAGLNVRLTQGTPASALALGTVQYSSNGGATWTYTPVSGGGGAPAGYDGAITHVRIPLTGNMATNGANCWLEYDVIVR